MSGLEMSSGKVRKGSSISRSWSGDHDEGRSGFSRMSTMSSTSLRAEAGTSRLGRVHANIGGRVLRDFIVRALRCVVEAGLIARNREICELIRLSTFAGAKCQSGSFFCRR